MILFVYKAPLLKMSRFDLQKLLFITHIWQ